MNKLQLEPEFVKLIQGIYGDANLDERAINQLYQTWKTNPNFLINAYSQKQGVNPVASVQRAPSRLNMASPLQNPTQIKLPQREVAQDDLSGITNFSDAFKVARQNNLSQFRWRGTKANPSGLFKVDLRAPKPSAPAAPVEQPTSTPQKTSRGTMSKAYWKSMIDKGFTWDSRKQMWINPQKAAPTEQQPNNKQTSQELFAQKMAKLGMIRNSDGTYSKPTPKKQEGGKLEDSQKAFVAYLIQVSGAQSEQELNDFIQSLGEEGLKQQYQQFIQTMQNGTQSAKNGAKLNYIKSLRGVCPDGYELGYFKEGGQICAKCVEKREKMGGIPIKPIQGEKGTKVVQDFKKDLKNKKDKITIDSKKKPEKKELGGVLNINPELLDMFKCGGKSKKMKKKEDGGLMKKKQGIPIKEKFIDKDKCGKKMKKKK